MNYKRLSLLIGLLVGALGCFSANEPAEEQIDESLVISYIVDPSTQDLRFFWKDAAGNNYSNFEQLQLDLQKQNKELVFAMNGGMYNRDLSPQGLYIEEGKTYAKLDSKKEGYGNFYLQPNGIFYLTKEKKGVVCTTQNFIASTSIECATQSGPMLVIAGAIHPKFREGSENLHIRNGVGVLPDGKLLFAMSKAKINLYDFASYFQQYGCENALYLDGFVSKVYLPTKNWKQEKGTLGVMIGEIK